MGIKYPPEEKVIENKEKTPMDPLLSKARHIENNIQLPNNIQLSFEYSLLPPMKPQREVLNATDSKPLFSIQNAVKFCCIKGIVLGKG